MDKTASGGQETAQQQHYLVAQARDTRHAAAKLQRQLNGVQALADAGTPAGYGGSMAEQAARLKAHISHLSARAAAAEAQAAQLDSEPRRVPDA